MKETNRNRANVAKRRARQRKLRNRRIALTVCLMLVVMVASIGGTVAWLTAKTAPVVNTFTYGDINITLAETTGNSYKIIPGVDIEKDPKVTVKGGSEACYLFVKVDEADWPTVKEANGTTKKVNYAIASDWTPMPNVANVYYREVSASEADQPFGILANDQVTVSANLTKTEVNDLKTKQPKLTFTAYAVQLEGFEDKPADAWAKVNP